MKRNGVFIIMNLNPRFFSFHINKARRLFEDGNYKRKKYYARVVANNCVLCEICFKKLNVFDIVVTKKTRFDRKVNCLDCSLRFGHVSEKEVEEYKNKKTRNISSSKLFDFINSYPDGINLNSITEYMKQNILKQDQDIKQFRSYVLKSIYALNRLGFVYWIKEEKNNLYFSYHNKDLMIRKNNYLLEKKIKPIMIVN